MPGDYNHALTIFKDRPLLLLVGVGITWPLHITGKSPFFNCIWCLLGKPYLGYRVILLAKQKDKIFFLWVWPTFTLKVRHYQWLYGRGAGALSPTWSPTPYFCSPEPAPSQWCSALSSLSCNPVNYINTDLCASALQWESFVVATWVSLLCNHLFST